MTKRKRPPPFKVDLGPVGKDTTLYAMQGQAMLHVRGADHEDALARVGHFLNHPTATRLMTACGIEGFMFQAKAYGIVDKERKRVVQEATRNTIIDPRTGKPMGEH